MKPRAYATADAFKAALDQRLRNVAEPGVGITRRRQLLVFDRYLARLGQYEGQRFRAECRLARMLYGQAFGIDVAFGDPMLGEPEIATGDALLSFAGIEPATLRLYPVETHIAEKLHAYTLPRATPSTRVKDLPDLALLGQAGAREATTIREALEQTFGFRKTHPVPERLPEPPLEWEAPYAAMAAEDDLPWPTLSLVTAAARAFLDPVLAGGKGDRWSPATWTWAPAR